MCLVEANQSVYPLDIVRQMRDQRAMLIQTSVSTTLMSGYTVKDFDNMGGSEVEQKIRILQFS